MTTFSEKKVNLVCNILYLKSQFLIVFLVFLFYNILTATYRKVRKHTVSYFKRTYNLIHTAEEVGFAIIVILFCAS